MNEMSIEFLSKLENEAFLRTSVIAFLMPLNLTMDEVMEIKTLLAEAVVNAMIHGYDGNEDGRIKVSVGYDEKEIHMMIEDEGCGIEDLDQAMQPLYTSKQHLERSGMGMTIMQTFADDFHVNSIVGKGTSITIVKRLTHETRGK